MSETVCKMCGNIINFPEETIWEDRPEFCSNKCSKDNFRLNIKPYDKEWRD